MADVILFGPEDYEGLPDDTTPPGMTSFDSGGPANQSDFRTAAAAVGGQACRSFINNSRIFATDDGYLTTAGYEINVKSTPQTSTIRLGVAFFCEMHGASPNWDYYFTWSWNGSPWAVRGNGATRDFFNASDDAPLGTEVELDPRSVANGARWEHRIKVWDDGSRTRIQARVWLTDSETEPVVWAMDAYDDGSGADPRLLVGSAGFYAARTQNYFDDFTIWELDANGDRVQEGGVTLDIDDMTHAQPVTSPVLGVGMPVDDAIHAHALTDPVIVEKIALALDDVMHAHQLSEPVMGVPLLLDDLAHAHEISDAQIVKPVIAFPREDFQSYPTGIMPPGWWGWNATPARDDSLFETADLSGSRVLSNTGTGESLGLAVENFFGFPGYDMYCDFRTPNVSDGYYGIAVFATLPSGTREYYHTYSFMSNAFFFRGVDGNHDFRDSGSGTPVGSNVPLDGRQIAPDEVWHHRVQIWDDNAAGRTYIRIKVWKDAEVEPVAWQANVYDQGDANARITQGHFGLFAQSGTGGIDNVIVYALDENGQRYEEGSILPIYSMRHDHDVENATVTEGATVVADAVVHAHQVTEPVLVYKLPLAVDDVAHAHEVDNVTLSSAIQLTIESLAHVQQVTEPAIAQRHFLAIEALSHAHEVDNAEIVQEGVIMPADMLHGHALGEPVMGTRVLPADLAHAHALTEPVIDRKLVLAIEDALHAHGLTSVTLSQRHFLVVNDTIHAHLVDNVGVFAGELYIHPDRLIVLAPESRIVEMLPDRRSVEL